MSEPWTVTITGGGVAAACCKHLLREQGAAVHGTADARLPVPAIMLSDPARSLLRECLAKPALFENNARITRRFVAWGGHEPVCLPHGAVMLGAGDLDFASPDAGPAPRAADFTIRTSRPAPDEPLLRFGERMGETVPVRLLMPEDADACWIESVEDGWLFMIPSAGQGGWLLAVGAPCAVLLEQSRHLAARVRIEARQAARFDTAPRMLAAMAGGGWLACGSSAMAFDPICGDGTALAVRQAILACAVALACREGEDAGALLGHYEAMMTAAMRRHLRHCCEFYGSGGTGPWWCLQQQALADGFAACTARLEREPPPRFALEGFRLVRRELAA
ncbi:hypothetical protein SAMN05518801_103151 [Novosphingobium sp. CF614]|uniref:hypothetical protein n=1 Tax=Novosphingobium sp. CF614 TaxID=1884364 RepID=UPI0008E3AF45|nr:hypothetical protein [Novosphingobium sp. CF614]SFF91619.1 hypothetical protein SAMN05518801_103151 [Novosphingobium sp. CF614]